MAAPRLILILGDQLSPHLSSLAEGDPARDRVVMAEVAGECDYVPHHRKKIAFLFAAMRHFAERLRQDGWRVDYYTLTRTIRTSPMPCWPAAATAAPANCWSPPPANGGCSRP